MTSRARHTRTLVLAASVLLSAAGWLSLLGLWWLHGEGAGVLASFVFAVTVAITFTITAAVTVVMPDSQRIYALGFRDGQRLGGGATPERARLLSVVR